MREDRLVVWHLLGPLRPSGMERMLVSAASHWPAHHRHVVVGQGDAHPFRADLERAGYAVATVPGIRTRPGRDALRAAVQRDRPDVLHLHTEGAFAAAVSATAGTVPVLRTVHNVFPVRGRASWSRRLQARLVDRRVAQFIAPSRDVADNEARIGRDCATIYNWVADGFLAPEQDGPVGVQARGHAIIVGNSSPIKNHVLALRALVESDAALAYLGDESGASVEESALLDRLAAEGRLLHRGVGDPLPWLWGAAVFLMPSRHEGMPVALAEALQLGIPAMVTDAPGLRWAADLPGVIALPFDLAAWRDALPRAMALGIDPGRAHPDFTAERGAAEYTAAYASAASLRSAGVG